MVQTIPDRFLKLNFTTSYFRLCNASLQITHRIPILKTRNLLQEYLVTVKTTRYDQYSTDFNYINNRN